MFLARRQRGERPAGAAFTGPVTLPGERAGAWLEGERRGVEVYAPGGYHWVPRLGEQMLVLKAGESGEQPCAVGVWAGGQDLQPGEVLITAGAASLKLSLDGTVEVRGQLRVNGVPVALQGVMG